MGIGAKCGCSIYPAFNCGHHHSSLTVCRRHPPRNIWLGLSSGQRREKLLFPSRASSLLACRPLAYLCRRSLPVSDCADIYSCCRIRLVYPARKYLSADKNSVTRSHNSLHHLFRRLVWRGFYSSVQSSYPPAGSRTNFVNKRARLRVQAYKHRTLRVKNSVLLQFAQQTQRRLK